MTALRTVQISQHLKEANTESWPLFPNMQPLPLAIEDELLCGQTGQWANCDPICVCKMQPKKRRCQSFCMHCGDLTPYLTLGNPTVLSRCETYQQWSNCVQLRWFALNTVFGCLPTLRPASVPTLRSSEGTFTQSQLMFFHPPLSTHNWNLSESQACIGKSNPEGPWQEPKRSHPFHAIFYHHLTVGNENNLLLLC